MDDMLETLDRVDPPTEVQAHCDVPCGIYDPHTAWLAARTVATMVQKMIDLPQPAPGDAQGRLNFGNTISRMIATKEEHAQLCKKELLILWTDYFKPQHLQMFPDLHTFFWNAAKLCSKNKQEVNLEAANQLVATCEEVGRMFEKSKG
ncbi:MAG: superoxide dismutase, Ni [Chloroflexi bacterium]|nr:superoxide dismutase, Ni [Chloroflexota bacterium]